MDNVKYYAFTLLCCSAACRIVEFMSPESCKKQISCVIGMILLICIISPIKQIKDINWDLEFNASDNTQVEANTDDIFVEQFKIRLTEIINDKLNSIGIIADNVRIDINISEQEVSIKSITVTLFNYDKDKIQEVNDILSEYLDMNVTVYAQEV